MPKDKYNPVPHDHDEFLRRMSTKKGFKEAYDALEQEYDLACEMLAARKRAGLTQEAVAEHMGTTKSAVSRLESVRKSAPSLTTLTKYAKAVGCKLHIQLLPQPEERVARRRTRS